MFNILLQVLDDGRVTDSQGRTVNFKNSIIILTSNMGSDIILSSEDADTTKAKVMGLVSALTWTCAALSIIRTPPLSMLVPQFWPDVIYYCAQLLSPCAWRVLQGVSHFRVSKCREGLVDRVSAALIVNLQVITCNACGKLQARV